MKTKNKISAYIFRNGTFAVVFLGAVGAFCSAINVPNQRLTASQNTSAFGVNGHESVSSLAGPTNQSNQTLSFAERVGYQRVIEEVYWRHRIWPEANPNPKPPLEQAMSHAEIEKKVEDYLRNSQLLQDYWQRPITADQLQGEMERMATHTKQPAVLQELFEALGNDPLIIAECLARPTLLEHLGSNFYGHDQKFQAQRRRRVEVDVQAENQTPQLMAAASTSFTLPTISNGPNGCIDNTWTATSISSAPDSRFFHTAVWTGSEMIVWGGAFQNTPLSTGGRYNPATDSWTATSANGAPAGRWIHTAVWTGSEMIVWGGQGSGANLNSGGRYNPATDSWTATSTTDAPVARSWHTAVWTGSQMIVWGGNDNSAHTLNTGGRYNPSTDDWTATGITNAPHDRFEHTAVWSGSEMIVWGGFYFDTTSHYSNTGGRYDPSTDNWTATSIANVPDGRRLHTAVWTGSEMIIWGGAGENEVPLNTGGGYNPGTDSWTATSTTNAPEPRSSHTAVWIGSEMIIWGGGTTSGLFDSGGKYTPVTDSWTFTSTADPPDARYGHTAVWIGSETIVWGGSDLFANYFNTGGRYCAQGGPTPTPTATPTPTPRGTPTPRPRPTPAPRP
jgi:N-acetylneuraminic acid mutarotase